ncbi:hypothetical protein [Okeania sp. SIO2C9]|nr:hypothetical protein [Okeania sp. SIO2C9]
MEKKKLSDRKHNCRHCNYQENRDVAAAPTPIPSREGSKRGG